jgi:pimeloyl-ACP methyl ester carboxylesterase
MEKLFIKNRKEQKVCVLVEETPNQKGLAFVMHGLSGYKEQKHIEVFADSFREHGFTVVHFDTTNTFGESDGRYEDATTTNYYEDLEDVIEWAAMQRWYEEPFVLAGHSLGGICTALYAERHPEKVKGLAPISTVVSGELSTETAAYKDDVEEWQRTGWLTETSHSGIEKKLKWSHMEDRLKYDLLPDAGKLTMPVLMLVGERDESTPAEHQRILYEALPGKKELHIIKGAPHTFREPEHLRQVRELFDAWIEKDFL